MSPFFALLLTFTAATSGTTAATPGTTAAMPGTAAATARAADPPRVQGRSADAPVAGVVKDADGAVIPGATVILRAASVPDRQTLTGPDGQFSVTAPIGREVTLIVRLTGFAEKRTVIAASAPRQNLNIQLSPAPRFESVTVTPTMSEQQSTDVAASVTVLDRTALRHTAAVVADDVLRQVPTFSLFRRSSSLALHPTSQGVSLRGIGPSGVSRTLVLLDGVPFNDPFGGWVYWSRVPLEVADRIEVMDGSGSSLYGNYAMGGVINIVTAPASARDARVQLAVRHAPQSKGRLRGE